MLTRIVRLWLSLSAAIFCSLPDSDLEDIMNPETTDLKT